MSPTHAGDGMLSCCGSVADGHGQLRLPLFPGGVLEQAQVLKSDCDAVRSAPGRLAGSLSGR